MKRIAPWFLFPPCAVAFCFLFECVTSGVDLRVSRDGDCVTVWATNAPPCGYLQGSENLRTWDNYIIYNAVKTTSSIPLFQWSVKAGEHRAFWRLGDCAAP